MPYSVGCSPAPLTVSITPRYNWQLPLSVAWVGFVGYRVFEEKGRINHFDYFFDLAFYGLITLGILLSFIRRERIEIYPDQMIWSKTYFGFTQSTSAPVADVLTIEWNEGEQRGHWRQSKGPDYVEFYLSSGSVKACFGFTFDEFEKMREDIRSMYPDLVKRWGSSTVRSKDFTLLNLS